MKIFEYVLIVLICLFFISFAYAVIDTASAIQENVKKEPNRISQLPSECEKYYNSGTDEWKDCMGVGYK